MIVAVAIRASTGLGSERDRQTLDGLLTTPLSNASLLGSKWLGAVLSVRQAWWGLGAVWLLGFLAIPWVEVNCDSLQLTLNHLAVGACGELDSADALSSQLVQHVSSTTWNLSEGIYPLYGALIGGAALLLFRGKGGEE